MQLWKSYIDDVNRIYKTDYLHNDAFDREKAIEITTKYLRYYGKKYEEKTGNRPTLEVLSRIHNGGPNGWKKESTIDYWNKVKKQLKGI